MTTERVTSEESTLLGRAREGDQVAFGQLVARHQHDVFTLAVRLVRDRELAADVAQEAFVRAWKAIPKFRGDAKFSTWMHRIVVNTAWTQRRRVARHATRSIDEVYTDPAASGVTPEQAGFSAAFRPRLEAALRQLSPPLRAVIVLKDVYEWSHAEIAEKLGISVTTAKVRLHRARRALRSTLWSDRDAVTDDGDAP